MTAKRNRILAAAAFVVFTCAFTPTAKAPFHTWDINEVFSDADGTVQFIELEETVGADNQQSLSGHVFTTNANTFSYLTNLPHSQTANRFFLMATADFSSLPGAVTPDYEIPESFFSIDGDFLNFAGVDFLSFKNGVVPTDGVLSLNRNLSTSPNSPTNYAGDMGMVPEPASLALLALGAAAILRRRRRSCRTS